MAAMECNTEAGILFDIGSMYAHFQGMQDIRKQKGLRNSLIGYTLIERIEKQTRKVKIESTHASSRVTSKCDDHFDVVMLVER